MYLAKAPTLSGFAFDFFDSTDALVGKLRWPDVAVATNARLKGPFPEFLSQKITLEIGDQAFEIEFEYLTRDWANDIEFRLRRGAERLAVASVTHPNKAGAKRVAIRIEEPFNAELISKSTLLGVRYELVRDGVRLGSVYEKGFSVNRRLWIDLPDLIPAPVQFFAFFLVCNQSFR